MKTREEIEHYLHYRTRELTPTDGMLFLGGILLVAALVREAGYIERWYYLHAELIIDEHAVFSAALGTGFIGLALFVRFMHRRLFN